MGISISRHPLVWILPLAAAAAVVMAMQGINHDQMIFYQAGLRSWAGQIPFRDYTVPQGPIAGLVFALFLRLVPGSGGIAFLAASATLSAAAAWLIWRFVWLVSGDRAAATVGALLTALWFLTVFGSYYNDHLAYVLCLAAATATLERRWWLTGVLFALAYHTKQTVGVWALVAFGVCELAAYRAERRRQWLVLLGAMAATHALVLGLIAASGGWRAYWSSAVRMPLQFAARAKGKSPWRIITFVLFPWNIDPIRMIREDGGGRLVFYPLVLSVYAGALALVQRRLPRPAAYGLGFLILSTLWGGAWLGRFQGQLVFGAAGALALTALAWRWRWRYVLGLFIPVALINIAAGGPWIKVRDPEYDDTDLRPIHMEDGALARSNAAVVRFLRDHPGMLAMSGGDTYYIAAALRRAPWNPSVYFEYPLTVPLDPTLLAEWENDYIAALERHGVRYIVADTTWSEKDYVRRLKSWVMAHYHQIYRYEPLVVLEKNGSSP